MSIKEKYGTFQAKEITFYSKEDYLKFQKFIYETYENYLYKVNGIGKKKGKLGFIPYRTEEQKDYLSALKLSIYTDDEKETINIYGYGLRNHIFIFEMMLRKMFDEKKICTYDIKDQVQRTIEIDEEELEDELDEFKEEIAERKAEYEDIKKGHI